MESSFLDRPVPFGMAHQGGTDVAPGNTEAAFQHAVSLGYDYIETDVQLTADGVLVTFHDDELAPLTGADGSVADYTWLQLTELRVGGEHPIPRFADIVDRFPGVRFNVEPKSEPSVQGLIDFVNERGLGPRICIGSFSDDKMARIRRGLPGVCTSPGPKEAVRILLRALLGSSKRSPYAALQIPESYVGIPLTGRWLVSRYQRQGLQVHVWTVNDEASMRRLLDAGVDAIISDEVTLLKQVLTERGAWRTTTGEA